MEFTDIGYPFASVETTTEDESYPASRLINGRIRESDYTCSGTQPIELWFSHSGWKSVSESDESGDLASSEVIDIFYFDVIRKQNFMIIAPEDNYPVDFTIEISADGEEWTEVIDVTDNDNPFYGYRLSQIPTEYQYCRITISKISATESPVQILQAGAVVSLVFDIYDIDRISIHEELQGETGNPAGAVSSDYCEFSLNNENEIWRYDNSDSPFQALLNDRYKIRAWVGLETSTDYFEMIQLGHYFSNTFSLNTEELKVNFTANDLIYLLKDQKPPILAVKKDTTIKTLWEELFRLLNLDRYQYQVSKTLTQSIPYGFFAGEVGENFSGETVGECMQVLAVAGFCNCRCNRDGIIEVRSNFRNDSSGATITDTTQVYRSVNQLDFSDVYDAVRVRYKIPQGYSDEEELITIEDYSSGLSNNQIEIEFPDAIGVVTRIQIENSNYTTLNYADIGATRAILYFTNETAVETIQIRVFGKKLKFFNTSYYQACGNIDDPQKELKISNWLIQNYDTAKRYSDALIQYVHNPCNKYEIEIRGNPAIETGSVIAINDATNNIVKDLQVIKQVLTWQSFITSTLECREPITEYYWAYVMPTPYLEPATVPEKITQGYICAPQVNIDIDF